MKRPGLILKAVILSLLVFCSSAPGKRLPDTVPVSTESAAPVKPAGRIDTHIHLYDTEREGSVVFINPADHAKIYFPHLPQQFLNTAGPAGIGYAIVVEASKRREDNYWLVETVNGSDAMLACIGNLDPRDPDYYGDLDRLSEYKKFRGIRIRPKTSFNYSDPSALDALGRLDELGLVLELGPGVATGDVVNIARKYPGMHVIMNHLAGGRKKDGKLIPEDWEERLAALAAQPNIYCKISMVYYLSGEKPSSHGCRLLQAHVRSNRRCLRTGKGDVRQQLDPLGNAGFLQGYDPHVR